LGVWRSDKDKSGMAKVDDDNEEKTRRHIWCKKRCAYGAKAVADETPHCVVRIVHLA
jgi:hypothetical protein